jgi:hypothetical protein
VRWRRLALSLLDVEVNCTSLLLRSYRENTEDEYVM